MPATDEVIDHQGTLTQHSLARMFAVLRQKHLQIAQQSGVSIATYFPFIVFHWGIDSRLAYAANLRIFFLRFKNYCSSHI